MQPDASQKRPKSGITLQAVKPGIYTKKRRPRRALFNGFRE
jgi:hypothetical protein